MGARISRAYLGVNHLSQRQLGKVRVARLLTEGVAFRCMYVLRHVTTLAVRGDQWPNPLPAANREVSSSQQSMLPDCTEGVVCALNFCTPPFEVRVQIVSFRVLN